MCGCTYAISQVNFSDAQLYRNQINIDKDHVYRFTTELTENVKLRNHFLTE